MDEPAGPTAGRVTCKAQPAFTAPDVSATVVRLKPEGM
jgi:hypothetical protein